MAELLEKQLAEARAQGMREAAETYQPWLQHKNLCSSNNTCVHGDLVINNDAQEGHCRTKAPCDCGLAATIERAAEALQCAIAGCDREVSPRPRTCLEHTPGIIPPDDERAADKALGGKP